MTKHAFHTYFEDAKATDTWPLFTTGPGGGKLTRVTHKVAGSSTPTVNFNLEKRDEDDPFSAGVDVWSGDKTADTTSTSESSFDAGTIAARQSVFLAASAIGGTVDKVMISGEWQDPDIIVSPSAPAGLDYAGGTPTILIAEITIDVSPAEPGQMDYRGTRVEFVAGIVRRRYAAQAPSKRRLGKKRRTDVRPAPPAGPWNS